MSKSQNGWPQDPKVVRIFVGGDKDGAEFRVGDVAKVFTWFLTKFHDSVEPITQVNGYRSVAFNNSIPGSIRNSNHTSGTAGDVNGAEHPNQVTHPGATSGFTAAQTTRIRALLKYADGILEWGADFPSGTKDFMHFAIARGTTAAQVAAFVKKITPEDDMPTVKNYSTTVAQPIKDPTKWQTVKFTDEGGTSIASNPQAFNVDVKIRLSGVGSGQTIQARVYRVDAKEGTTTVRTGTYDLVERQGTSGDTFIDLSQNGGEQKPATGRSNRIRVEVLVPTKGAKIVKATAKSMTW